MSGRTSWWAKDAAWHRRELQVELGEEFGAEGPHVLDVLSSWAQEQRAGGEVRGGFRALSREAFVTLSHAESIVRHAGAIGALDDLDIDEDGRRFTCRVSGFRADQQRGRAAWRKADERHGNGKSADGDPTGHTVTDGDMSRPVTPSALPDQTIPTEHLSEDEPEGKVVRFDRKAVPADRVALAERILDEFNRQAATGYGAFTGRDRPSEDLKRILGALADAEPPLTFEEAARMIRVRLADPFWTGRPHTGVVFGPRVFAANREQALAGPATSSAGESARLAARLNGRGA